MDGADSTLLRPRASLLSRIDAKVAEKQAASPQPVPEETPPPVTPANDDPESLPKAGSHYQARSRVTNKPELMLTLMLKDGSRQGFAYMDLRYVDYHPAGGSEGLPLLLLRFLGVGDVRLEGRNLDVLHEDLRRHMVGWVRERPAGRDYIEDRNALVITGIHVELAK